MLSKQLSYRKLLGERYRFFKIDSVPFTTFGYLFNLNDLQ